MIAIQELKPHAFDIALAGPIQDADIATLEAKLAPYLQDEGAVDAVIDLTGVEAGPATNLSRLCAQADKLGRLAIVGAHGPSSAVERAVGQLMPRGQFRQFGPSDRASAQAFVLA